MEPRSGSVSSTSWCLGRRIGGGGVVIPGSKSRRAVQDKSGRSEDLSAGILAKHNLRPIHRFSSTSALTRPDFAAATSAAWSRTVWSA